MQASWEGETAIDPAIIVWTKEFTTTSKRYLFIYYHQMYILSNNRFPSGQNQSDTKNRQWKVDICSLGV